MDDIEVRAAEVEVVGDAVGDDTAGGQSVR